jgi:flavin-binding protein dodecin
MVDNPLKLTKFEMAVIRRIPMARVEGSSGGGQVDTGSSQPSFSDATKGAIETAAKETGAFDDKKLEMGEVADIRSQLEENSPEAASEIAGMSDDELKTELEKAFADQLTGEEEAPEEAAAGEAPPPGGEAPPPGGEAPPAGGAEEPAGEGSLDINKDGVVDEKDFELLMKKFDKNGDGKLDKKEMAAAGKELGMKPGELEKMLDKDGDGEATKGEIGEAIKAEGEASGAETGTDGGGESLSGANDISSFLQQAA